jgi:hypothetical protein
MILPPPVSPAAYAWFKALAAACISGAAHAATSSLSAMIIAPGEFNFAGGVWHSLALAAATALIGGAVSASAYLQKSPLPEESPK